MNEHQVYIVTTLREYENDEKYFGCDGIFASGREALALIKKDIAELRKEYPDASYQTTENQFILCDSSHKFTWQLEQGFLPAELFQKGE